MLDQSNSWLRWVLDQCYYLRIERDESTLAYPPMLTVELGSYVDGEAHGWAR